MLTCFPSLLKHIITWKIRIYLWEGESEWMCPIHNRWGWAKARSGSQEYNQNLSWARQESNYSNHHCITVASQSLHEQKLDSRNQSWNWTHMLHRGHPSHWAECPLHQLLLYVHLRAFSLGTPRENLQVHTIFDSRGQSQCNIIKRYNRSITQGTMTNSILIVSTFQYSEIEVGLGPQPAKL